MAGKLTFFFAACILTAANPSDSPAQTPADSPTPPPSKRPGWFGGGGRDQRRPGVESQEFEKFDNVRKAIDALTPEQRKRFQENFLRWSNLSPEEKKALSDREAFRRKKIAADVDAALKEVGLELDSDRRELFAKRYGEERHKIEEQLRKDMDEKRQPLLKEVIAKLKAEFANGVATKPEAPGASSQLPDAAPQPVPAKP